MKKLRFAPIIRVSTEKQKERGESLNVQTEQITQYVELLNGVIPEHCTQYSGQEHATPDQERAKLDKLLEDSSKDLFDAVIVVDTSRWSRDNLKNKEALKILKENGIRFFAGTMEYDLFSAFHNLMLGMSAEIGEFEAKNRVMKSILSRIARAKENKPAVGKLPYGRTYDKKTGKWDVDKDKKRLIEKAAKRYLDPDNDEGFEDIAKTLDIDTVSLWKILTQRSGTEWENRFRYENIDEPVILKVPRLLPQSTINAIHERAAANKTYKHGEIKHHYLLSRMIFCKKCGYAMTGQTNKSGTQYYRPINTKNRVRKCEHKKLLPAADIGNAVLLELARTFGDPIRIKKAIKDATPDLEKINARADEKVDLVNKLTNITKQINTLVEKIAEGLVTDAQAKKTLDKYQEKQDSFNKRLQRIELELKSIPDPAKIKRLSYWSGRVLSNAIQTSPRLILKRPYEKQRQLVEHAFGDIDIHGKRLGVYVEETGDAKQPWRFEIRAGLETTILGLPLEDEYLEDAFGLDSDYQDVAKELEKIKQDLFSV